MTKQVINLGTAPSGIGGDDRRSAWLKAIANFDEIYAALGGNSIPAALPVAKGGTGGTTAAAARAGLGLGAAAVAAILGTVSQSSGVPAGAIMERGSNSNGEYVRFADGTQICWGFKNSASIALGAASGPSITYPIAFAANPTVSATVNPSTSWDHYGLIGLNSLKTSGVDLLVRNGNSSAQIFGFYWMAIGRWV